MAPIDAVRSRMKGRNAIVGAVDTIYVKGSSPEQLTELQDQATEILRERHKISDPSQDDFRILNSASLLEAGQSTTQTFTLLLGGVAAVSLLVGGVGIMNIMLVAVTERTREIGLRMALGARRKDILRQFAIESTALAGGGRISRPADRRFDRLGVVAARRLAHVDRRLGAARGDRILRCDRHRLWRLSGVAGGPTRSDRSVAPRLTHHKSVTHNIHK